MNKILDTLLKEVSVIIKDKGYNIDDMSYTKSQNKRSKLLVVISKIDNTPVNINDCSVVSRFISMIIDVKNIITEAYTLEVSSKGSEDSLYFFNDFVRNIGKAVKVSLFDDSEQGSFVGTIVKASGDKIIFNKHCDVKNNYVTIYVNNIKNAVLIKDISKENHERNTRIR